MKVEDYERQVIKLLCNDVIANALLHEVINSAETIECKFTGEGYYLDLAHKDLPDGRIVCEKPHVVGKYQEQEVGFVVFIESGVLCLECYNYSSKGVPESIRSGTVEISVA